MRYWWVNHKQTVKQEVSGGYLWSPEREANGARSQFYDNMRLAEPGDWVLSYAGGVLGNIGRVIDFAVPAPKPDSFGATGEYWSKNGWLLPVAWQPLDQPIRPKDKFIELQQLLPKKYSPISLKNGSGSQKAYLAEVSLPVFELLLDGQISQANAIETDDSQQNAVSEIENAIEKEINEDLQLDDTTRQQVVLARKGQGLFRRNVAARYGMACALTGVSNPALLVASHIKPWRVCESAEERLSGENGLMLAIHVDKLFDKGFISFTDSGNVLLSPMLSNQDLIYLGLVEVCDRGIRHFEEEKWPYFDYHRSHVFLKK